MESIQTLLVIIIIFLSTLLVVLGWQVLMIIMQIRSVLKKINTILDDTISGRGFLEMNKLRSILEFFKKRK